jgi:hypothetical protein
MRRFVGVVLAFGAVLVLSGCAAKTTDATNITDISATLHATASCDSGQTCTWYWQIWPANQPRSSGILTAPQGPVPGPIGDVNLSINITGLIPSTSYRWVFCASPNNGGTYVCTGPNGTFGSRTADPPPDYATLTTAPLRTLAERWDGTGWAVQTTPNPSGATDNSLGGASCTSATACTAVGSYGIAGALLTLAERWDGTSWTIQPTPNPTGAKGSSLSGVSCTSATVCTAVGNYTNSGGTQLTLAERWDGTAWTIQPTPNPTGAADNRLFGVSCTSATACTAVGSYASAGGLVTLAERWDGTAWTIQPTPNPTGAGDSSLQGVSCTSATACTAVGNYFDTTAGFLTLAERWDGTTWTIQPTPNPAGGQDNFLSGVSCTSATACTAAGSFINNAGTSGGTLAERWDGTTWTALTTPNPAGGAVSSLSGVSCTSATACTAVGNSSNSTRIPVTLAERWDGTTWTIQPTPNPPGQASLSGVSCTSALACTATGSY